MQNASLCFEGKGVEIHPHSVCFYSLDHFTIVYLVFQCFFPHNLIGLRSFGIIASYPAELSEVTYTMALYVIAVLSLKRAPL